MSGCGERFSNGSTSCAGKRRTDSAASDPVNSQAERMAAWRASAALLSATRISEVVFAARTNNGRYSARAVKVRPETRLRPLPTLRWRRTRSKGTEFSRSASSSRTNGKIIAGLSLPAHTPKAWWYAAAHEIFVRIRRVRVGHPALQPVAIPQTRLQRVLTRRASECLRRIVCTLSNSVTNHGGDDLIC